MSVMDAIRARNAQLGVETPEPGPVGEVSPAEHVRRRQEIAAAAQNEATEADKLRAQAWMGLLEQPEQALGSIGGLVGGRFGQQAGIGGAAVGGMIGALPKTLALALAGDAPTPQAAISRITDAGANQALLEAGGRILTSPLTAIAGRLAGRQLRNAKAEVRKLLIKAHQAGVRYDPLQLMDGIDGLMHEAAIIGVNEVKMVADMAQNYMGNKISRMINPLEVMKFRKTSDKLAEKLWEKIIAKREYVAPGEMLFAKFHKMVADNGRRMLNEIGKGSPFGVEALQAKTRDEIIHRKTLQQLARKVVGPIAGGLGAGAIGWAKGGPIGAGVMAPIGGAASLLLTTPQMLELLGMVASHPALVNTLRQVPRAGAALAQGQ